MIIINRNQAGVINTPHGSQIRPLIDATTSPIKLCSLAEEILPPGAEVGLHHHELTEEVYYILSGSGLMKVGEEVREVKIGDAIFIPRQYLHSLRNTGQEPMRLLLICGPAYAKDDHLMNNSSDIFSDLDATK
ncbi:MAG: cupin domain-containing protein [Pyrinomonadaceae bacterium]